MEQHVVIAFPGLVDICVITQDPDHGDSVVSVPATCFSTLLNPSEGVPGTHGLKAGDNGMDLSEPLVLWIEETVAHFLPP